MKRFAIAALCVVGLMSGCNDEVKPKPDGTWHDAQYTINAGFATLDGGPNGESMYIKVDDSTYKASHGTIAFDVTITNKGVVTIDAPIFYASYKGEDCGNGVYSQSSELIRQGESRKVTIIWNCGTSGVNPEDVDLIGKLGDVKLMWTHR